MALILSGSARVLTAAIGSLLNGKQHAAVLFYHRNAGAAAHSGSSIPLGGDGGKWFRVREMDNATRRYEFRVNALSVTNADIGGSFDAWKCLTIWNSTDGSVGDRVYAVNGTEVYALGSPSVALETDAGQELRAWKDTSGDDCYVAHAVIWASDTLGDIPTRAELNTAASGGVAALASLIAAKAPSAYWPLNNTSDGQGGLADASGNSWHFAESVTGWSVNTDEPDLSGGATAPVRVDVDYSGQLVRLWYAAAPTLGSDDLTIKIDGGSPVTLTDAQVIGKIVHAVIPSANRAAVTAGAVTVSCPAGYVTGGAALSDEPALRDATMPAPAAPVTPPALGMGCNVGSDPAVSYDPSDYMANMLHHGGPLSPDITNSNVNGWEICNSGGTTIDRNPTMSDLGLPIFDSSSGQYAKKRNAGGQDGVVDYTDLYLCWDDPAAEGVELYLVESGGRGFVDANPSISTLANGRKLRHYELNVNSNTLSLDVRANKSCANVTYAALSEPATINLATGDMTQAVHPKMAARLANQKALRFLQEQIINDASFREVGDITPDSWLGLLGKTTYESMTVTSIVDEDDPDGFFATIEGYGDTCLRVNLAGAPSRPLKTGDPVKLKGTDGTVAGTTMNNARASIYVPDGVTTYFYVPINKQGVVVPSTTGTAELYVRCGAAPERLAEVLTAAGADIAWIMQGHHETDARYTAYLTRLKAKWEALTSLSGKKVATEPSNEDWNGGFSHFAYWTGAHTTIDDENVTDQQSAYAWHAKRAHDNAVSVFGAGNVLGGIAGQAANANNLVNKRAAALALGWTPDFVACAPYADLPGTLAMHQKLTAPAFESLLEAQIRNRAAGSWGAIAANAATWGCLLFTYEVNNHAGSGDSGVRTELRRAGNHWGIGCMLQFLYQTLADLGWDLIVLFTLDGSWGKSDIHYIWAIYATRNMVSGVGDGSDGKNNNLLDLDDLDSAVSPRALVHELWSAASVGGDTAPVIALDAINRATQGEAFSQSLTVTGGEDPITLDVPSGTPQTGLSISTAVDRTFTLTGTPTVTGVQPIQLRATDNDADVDTRDINIYVDWPGPASFAIYDNIGAGGNKPGTAAMQAMGFSTAIKIMYMQDAYKSPGTTDREGLPTESVFKDWITANCADGDLLVIDFEATVNSEQQVVGAAVWGIFDAIVDEPNAVPYRLTIQRWAKEANPALLVTQFGLWPKLHHTAWVEQSGATWDTIEDGWTAGDALWQAMDFAAPSFYARYPSQVDGRIASVAPAIAEWRGRYPYKPVIPYHWWRFHDDSFVDRVRHQQMLAQIRANADGVIGWSKPNDLMSAWYSGHIDDILATISRSPQIARRRRGAAPLLKAAGPNRL